MNAQCLQQLWPKTKYLHFGHKILSKRLILERMKGQVKKMLCHINYSFIGHRSDKYLALPLSSLAWLWKVFEKHFCGFLQPRWAGVVPANQNSKNERICLSKDVVWQDLPPPTYFVYQKGICAHTVPIYMCRLLLQKQWTPGSSMSLALFVQKG